MLRISFFGIIIFGFCQLNYSQTPGNLTAGSIGVSQSICYNSAPVPLTQITAPTGGTGTYTFQWQSSPDNLLWKNITGATLSGYSPPALSASTYYRRIVKSHNFTPVMSIPVRITVSPLLTLARLNYNNTIYNNTSTNINIAISGGTSPYLINYTRNGVAQTSVINYTTGTGISTGVLTKGTYIYELTSVRDANGCNAQSLGTGITLNVTDDKSTYTPVTTLFSTEVPDNYGADNRYELGTEFQTLDNGYITKVRLFSGMNEGGDHLIRLWKRSESQPVLIAGPYTWNFSAGIQGWREFTLPSPIAVSTNKTYIIAVTNSTDKYYAKRVYFNPIKANGHIRYVRGLYSIIPGSPPITESISSSYFRDIVFSKRDNIIGNLNAGTIGAAQSICYNSVPSPLTQITAPTDGTGSYTFQWQSSPDNLLWTNITGAISSDYSPPALSASTYYRRIVTSGSYTPVNSVPILITVSPLATLAQLNYNNTIYNNTSTNFNIAISGGISPFTINYTRNGVVQTTISNYTRGTEISTGDLTKGTYLYTLTSVRDAIGCNAQSLGTNITVNVSENQGFVNSSNKALVVVNSTSLYYSDYVNYIKPYLDNFGIPYDIVNISTTGLPEFSQYAIVIFGHNNVYSTGYPITRLEASINNGTGLYSFDPHLFDFPSRFNTPVTKRSVNSRQISISNTTHYITRYHAPDTYNPTNNIVNLLNNWTVVQNSSLTGGVDLATMSSGGQTVSLLQVSNYGKGKVVKWCGYDWVFEKILGPVYGMDDLLWRGIVWAARKPFVMQGLPPMITMRVDDVLGGGGELNNFEWIKICNEFGIIPWCGTFNYLIPTGHIPTLKSLIDNNFATASPHGFHASGNEFLYFNHYNLASFDAAANVRLARDFYNLNGLKISKFFVPHYYEISPAALTEVRAMGGEFIAIHMLPDRFYAAVPWLNCGPYRINRNGVATETRPVYYGGNINLSGIDFFNCAAEIRDDGGYEWYPDNDIATTSARGIRHLTRSLNSMVLPSLFTHERFFDNISAVNFKEIIRQITSSISVYNPEYKSTDYAVQYIRARNNIRITNIRENLSDVEISYTGNNDLDTKCYLFTEQGGQITYRFVGLPRINNNGNMVITIPKQAATLTGITVTGAGGATTITTYDGTLQLNAEVLPYDAPDKTATWSIVNGTGEATINTAGLVTAVDNGTVTAMATANDGSGVIGTLTITISNQKGFPTGISVAKEKSESLKIIATGYEIKILLQDDFISWKADLYNVQGNLLLSKIVDSDIFRFDISSLPSGIYLVVLSKGEKRIVSKIIKP